MATLASVPYKEWETHNGVCRNYDFTGPAIYWASKVVAMNGLTVTETGMSAGTAQMSVSNYRKNVSIDALSKQLDVNMYRVDGTYMEEKVSVIVNYDTHTMAITAPVEVESEMYHHLTTDENVAVKAGLITVSDWPGECLAYTYDVDEPMSEWIEHIFALKDFTVLNMCARIEKGKVVRKTNPTVEDVVNVLPAYISIDGTIRGGAVTFMIGSKKESITLVAPKSLIKSVAKAFEGKR